MKKDPVNAPRFTKRNKSQLFAFFIQAPIAIILAILLRSCTPDEKNRVKAVEIANETQLLLDDYIIGQMTGLERTFHKPQKKGLIEEADGSDWERGPQTSVVRDLAGKFHMIYRFVWSDPGVRDLHPSIGDDKAHWFRRTYAYAQSEDGIRWTKPVLGLIDGPIDIRRAPKEKWADGIFFEPTGFSKQNNLDCPIAVIQDLGNFGGMADPKRRYLVNVLYRDDTHNFAPITDAGLYFATDVPDILNDPDWRGRLDSVWQGPKRGPRGEATHVDGFDTWENLWFVCPQSRLGGGWQGRGGRDIARYTSKDLINWSAEQVALPIAGDESCRTDDWIEYMDMRAFLAGGLWLGQLCIFHGDRTSPQYMMPDRENVWRKGTTELRLVLSRDAGKSWQRVGGKQIWLPHSKEKYGYDRLVFPGSPVRVGDELWLYYNAYDGDHLIWNRDGTLFDKQRPSRIGRVALATMRWDGYVSLDASGETGKLITKLLRFKGDKLWVNLDASKGALKVELQDENGQAIPGFALEDCQPVQENGINLSVSWQKGKLSKLAGRAIRVRFEIENASLFAFGFTN